MPAFISSRRSGSDPDEREVGIALIGQCVPHVGGMRVSRQVDAERPTGRWPKMRPRSEVQKRAAWAASIGQLFPREHGRQMPELGFHIGGIDHSIRDFLAKEFAIPLAKPVNGDLERSL